MEKLIFNVTYFKDGRKYVIPASENTHFKIEYEAQKNSFKAKITAKQKITLHRIDIIADYEFKNGDKFFGNGYQSWTLTREYSKADKMKDITPLAVVKPLKELAGVSSDCRFVEFPKKAGEFYSHCYTYIRNGENLDFIGSLSEKQGFTVIYADMNNNKITLSKDVEGVTIEGEYDLFDMFMINGKYDEVFEAYFEKMGVKKPKIDHLAGYTSWYNYFRNIDEDIIIRDLNALDSISESVSIFQIDDGYQSAVGDWTEVNKEKFPKGMKYIVDEIHCKGYLAGLWLAPFYAQITSKVVREHRDWLIKTEGGLPEYGMPNWGGTFTLDICNAEAREYIKHFFDVILNEWGFDMVKLDFLYAECVNPRFNKSRGQLMCEAMEFLRECCGEKLILGCGVPLGPAFGYVDACRIGNDVDLTYKGKFYNALHINNEVPSAQNSIINAIFRRHLDNRVFVNDPDVFFMRYSNLKFTQEQKELLATVNHMFGNVLFVSDNAAEYTRKDSATVQKAFSKFNGKILSAEMNNGIFTVDYEENGAKKVFDFDLKEGTIIRGKPLGE